MQFKFYILVSTSLVPNYNNYYKSFKTSLSSNNKENNKPIQKSVIITIINQI